MDTDMIIPFIFAVLIVFVVTYPILWILTHHKPKEKP